MVIEEFYKINRLLSTIMIYIQISVRDYVHVFVTFNSKKSNFAKASITIKYADNPPAL